MEHSFLYRESDTAIPGALAACFYSPGHSLWQDGGWKCPHCSQLSGDAQTDCRCGFSLENLADFHNGRTFAVAKLILVRTL